MTSAVGQNVNFGGIDKKLLTLRKLAHEIYREFFSFKNLKFSAE